MIEKDKKILEILNEDWLKLEVAISGMKQSLQRCEKIGIKSSYSFEEMKVFDSLSSKLSRNSNILFQKIFKSIIILSRERTPTSFIDKINLLAKMNVIQNPEMAIAVRDYRNQIVHEYFIDQIINLYPQHIYYTHQFILLHEDTQHFLISKNWIYHQQLKFNQYGYITQIRCQNTRGSIG